MAGVLVRLSGSHEPEVVAHLEQPGSQLRVLRRCADLTELIGAAEAGIGDVAVLELGRGVDAARVAHLRRCGVATVVVAEGARAQRALAIGADAVVPDGEGLGERLLAVISEVLARRSETGQGAEVGGQAPAPAPAPGADGAGEAARAPAARMVVVWSAHGAPGRTSLALNLASELALQAPTMLVDADSVAPSLTQVLGVVEETAALPGLCRAAGQGVLDAAALAARSRRLPTGVLLVSGLTRAERWRELAPDHLDLVWRAARRSVAWIVVDVAGGLEAPPPRGADRWGATRSALAAADDVVVVVAADPVGVRRGVHALTDLDDAGITARRHLVANRVRPSRQGRAGDAVARALEQFAGTTPVALVPQDPAFDDALLAGTALRETDRRSPARRAVATLAGTLAGPVPAQRERRPGRRGARLA